MNPAPVGIVLPAGARAAEARARLRRRPRPPARAFGTASASARFTRQRKTIADVHAAFRQAARRELDDGATAERCGQSPRLQAVNKANDGSTRVDERDVDREPHADGVDRDARRDEHGGIRLERITAQQSLPAVAPRERHVDG